MDVPPLCSVGHKALACGALLLAVSFCACISLPPWRSLTAQTTLPSRTLPTTQQGTRFKLPPNDNANRGTPRTPLPPPTSSRRVSHTFTPVIQPTTLPSPLYIAFLVCAACSLLVASFRGSPSWTLRSPLRFAVLIVNKNLKRKLRRAPFTGQQEEQVAPLEIKIRSMELRDTGPCFYLGEKAFLTGNLYRCWDEWEPVTLLSSCPEYCFVAVVADKRVVGFILGSVVHKRSLSVGYIDWVVVDSAYQRLGIGTRLVTKMCDVMRERENINLLMSDTPAENKAAIDFFTQHIGFTERVPHVYLSRRRDVHEYAKMETPVVRELDGQPVVVRPVMVDDLYKIFELGERVFNKHSNLSRHWDENEVMENFAQNSELCLVAMIGTKLAGFCFGNTVDKRKTKNPYGYLMWLAVDSSVGRRGVGTMLMQGFDRLMAEEGCDLVFADTQADNEAALKFFQAQGFGDPRQHLYMTKTFTLPEDSEGTIPLPTSFASISSSSVALET